MNIAFTSSFEKDLRKLQDPAVRAALLKVIAGIEAAQQPAEIAGLKKLKTGKTYCRVRLGDYRLGMIIQDNAVRLVRFLHRSEIYRFFP